MVEMAQNGVLIIASNNLSFSHKGPELQRIVTAYNATFAAIAAAIKDGSVAAKVGNSVVSAAPLRQTT
jgi:hypothetical protein